MNLTGGPQWTFAVGSSIAGEMAISLDGTYVYTTDGSGAVRAIRVRG